MFSVQDAVKKFHALFACYTEDIPTPAIPEDVVRLREDLITEEYNEFLQASEDGNIVDIADSLADLVYVCYGAALAYGIDLDSVLYEVHRSNMSKLDASGNILRREDGKVLKSDLFEPPDVDAVLASTVTKYFIGMCKTIEFFAKSDQVKDECLDDLFDFDKINSIITHLEANHPKPKKLLESYRDILNRRNSSQHD